MKLFLFRIFYSGVKDFVQSRTVGPVESCMDDANRKASFRAEAPPLLMGHLDFRVPVHFTGLHMDFCRPIIFSLRSDISATTLG